MGLLVVVSLVALYVSLAAMTLSVQSLWAVRAMAKGKRPVHSDSARLVNSVLWFVFWPRLAYLRWLA